MKKRFLFPTLAILALLFFQGTTKTVTDSENTLHIVDKDMPADVKAVVKQKCYGCHNAESKNEKGKKKLDWDAFEDSKRSKQMVTMSKINEVLVDGDMPPKKFLENKPEGKLSEAELATLMNWSSGKKK